MTKSEIEKLVLSLSNENPYISIGKFNIYYTQENVDFDSGQFYDITTHDNEVIAEYLTYSKVVANIIEMLQ